MERISRMTTVLLVSVRAFCVLFCLLAACSMDRKEVSRAPSPDHRVAAVIVNEMGGGAAGSSEYYVYMVEDKTAEELSHPVFTASNCAGLSAKWIDNNNLQLTYYSSCSIREFVIKWFSTRSTGHDGRRADAEITLTKAHETENERVWTRP